jgi:hypothetical protein
MKSEANFSKKNSNLVMMPQTLPANVLTMGTTPALIQQQSSVIVSNPNNNSSGSGAIAHTSHLVQDSTG